MKYKYFSYLEELNSLYLAIANIWPFCFLRILFGGVSSYPYKQGTHTVCMVKVMVRNLKVVATILRPEVYVPNKRQLVLLRGMEK